MPECPPIDLTCHVAGSIIDNTAGRFLDELAEQASKAAAEMLETLVAGWLAIDTPKTSDACRLDDAGKLACEGAVGYLREYTNWAVAAIAVGAVLVAAIKMALERNGREASTFGKNLVMLVVITVAGVPAVQTLVEIGDLYSNWILDASANGNLGKRLLLLAPAGGAIGQLSPLMVIGISIVMFLSTMVQLLLLLARNAGLVLLAGLLPVAAAVGGSVRSRYLTWLLALVLYKPAAATIYAAVFWLIGEGQTLTDLLTGMVMFAMAIVALPALMRLIAPAVAVMSTGGSSGIAVAAATAAGQVATGAVRLAGNSGGRSNGGGSGGGDSGRPGGAAPSTPVPAPRPTGESAGRGAAGAAGPAATGTGTAGTQAGAAGGTTAAAGGAAGAGTAAAGPGGLAAGAGVAAAKAGPTVVRKVGGTASGAVDGESG
ncbi:hypothetical protein AB0873_16455 [Micromonospora sp. NPDC047707]|uniref:hypothetical protein n=1 Tax=Micromonospora sp. NPDC047707 TaxID=3154498 RepID=UPI003451B35E